MNITHERYVCSQLIIHIYLFIKQPFESICLLLQVDDCAASSLDTQQDPPNTGPVFPEGSYADQGQPYYDRPHNNNSLGTKIDNR